jgi:phosphate transport system substrate-binding protein
MPLVAQESVPKTDISSRELEEIYSLRLLTWPDGSAIRIVLRPEGDIDTLILRGFSTALDKAVTMAQKREGMVVAITDPEAVEAIEKLPGGLGWTGLTSLIVGKPRLKPLSFNGVSPTVKNLADSSYPFAKPVIFVTTGRTSADALSFLNFVYSPEGRAIAERAGVQVITQ